MASPTTSDGVSGIACPRCPEKADKTCAGCKSIAYCSLECQEADWPMHEVLCSKFKDFSDDQRPRDDMRRMVVFHPDEDYPRFMWVPVEPHMDLQRLARDSVEVTQADGTRVNCQHLCPMEISTNEWTGDELQHPIHLLADSDFTRNFKRTNPTVSVATVHTSGHTWRGPLVACSIRVLPTKEGSDRTYEIQDMSMRDYADVLAFLVDYGHTFNFRHVVERRKKVDCVRIPVDSDGQFGSKLSLQAVRVPRSHLLFQDDENVLQVSKRLKMPLLARVCTNLESDAYPDNTPIQHLRFDCSRTSFFGPSYMGRGSWIVARHDKSPLDCKVVEALTDFCRYHLTAYFEKCKESIESEKKVGPSNTLSARIRKHREMVLEEITPEKFSVYILQWEAEKADAAAAQARGFLSYTPEKAKAGLERMGLTKDDYYRIITLLFNRSG